MTTTKKRFTLWAVVIFSLLLVPFLGTKFSTEVNWDLPDFLIMGTVLSIIALIYELVIRKSNRTIYRWAFILGILGAFLLFWVNGAVGIIGNEGQDANLLYGFVIIFGIIGSFFTKLKAAAMSKVMFGMALIQLLVPVVAILIWPPSKISWSPSVIGVFMLSSFFAVLFIVSAFLFKQASEQELRAKN